MFTCTDTSIMVICIYLKHLPIHICVKEGKLFIYKVLCLMEKLIRVCKKPLTVSKEWYSGLLLEGNSPFIVHSFVIFQFLTTCLCYYHTSQKDQLSLEGILFCLFRATPVAYGVSQARGRIRATAVGLCHSHSNTTATAAQDSSCIYDLHHSSGPCWILNPLGKVRDQICVLMDSSQIHFG